MNKGLQKEYAKLEEYHKSGKRAYMSLEQQNELVCLCEDDEAFKDYKGELNNIICCNCTMAENHCYVHNMETRTMVDDEIKQGKKCIITSVERL